MVEVTLKVYRRWNMEDKAYSIETVQLRNEGANERIEEWRNNPWFYEVLSVKYR